MNSSRALVALVFIVSTLSVVAAQFDQSHSLLDEPGARESPSSLPCI
jgi:hypothetical protein